MFTYCSDFISLTSLLNRRTATWNLLFKDSRVSNRTQLSDYGIMLLFEAESSCKLICKILYITSCGLPLLKFLQKSRKYDSVTENNTTDYDVGESAGQTHNPGPTGIGLRLLCNAPTRLIRNRIRWHDAVTQRLKYSSIARLQKKRTRSKLLRWQQKPVHNETANSLWK